MTDTIPHGTRNGYNNYKCRCDDCRAAARDYRPPKPPARREHGAACPCGPCTTRRTVDAAMDEVRQIPPDLDRTWTERAACSGLDPDLWFPGHGDAFTVVYAKQVCATCVVRDACLEYALAAGEKFGIWGGKSERERRRMRRARLAVAS